MLHSLYRPTEATRPLSVLLAEARFEHRELLARGLEAEGALVDCVEDGDVALARILEGRFRPDVVVSDVRMPGKTGLDLLRALRGAGLTIPVILLSGFGQAARRAEVEAYGGAVLLEKPFDFDDLHTALRNLPSIARLRAR